MEEPEGFRKKEKKEDANHLKSLPLEALLLRNSNLKISK